MTKPAVIPDLSLCSLMDLFERTIELTADCGLSSGVVSQADPFIRSIADRLQLTEREALMMSAFVDLSDDHHILIRDLAKHFGCKNIKIQTFWPELEALSKKRYISLHKDFDGDVSFSVPSLVVAALRENRPVEIPSWEGLGVAEWFDTLAELMYQRDRQGMAYEVFEEELQRLIDSNPDLPVSLRLKFYDLHHVNEDTVLLLAMMDLFVRNGDDHVMAHNINDILPSQRVVRVILRMLEAGNHLLQELGLVEYACMDGHVETNAWKLTDRAKQELLEGLTLRRKVRTNLLQAGKITPKKLFFPAEVDKQVSRLAALLQPERFREVQERLAEQGMRKGFACIFYGQPGTGKTESVLQLARQTGRDIKMVDVPNLRSKWVGDTEKNIKAVFDEYRQYCLTADRAPILLFNEADAVLCRRSEGATSGVDKMENAMQNIILQEMETLDGIMVATTNLTGNLDPAFERRFLYKIEFPKPTPEEARHIWQTMLPALGEEDARSLAGDYAFSGGQIENIARKHIVDSILYGSAGLDIESIREACRCEQFAKSSSSRIGFS